MKKLFAKPNRLPVTATREDEWDADMPTIKLSTAFLVILFLHVALVGGVMVFRMLDQSADRAESTATPQAAAPATADRSASTTSTGESDSASATADAAAATSTAAAPAQAAPAPEARNETPLQRHTVRHRESLDDIATRYSVSRQSIVTLNEISETNPFRENMTLLIPEPPRTMRAETPSGLASRSSSAAPEVRAARPVDDSAAPPRARAVEPAASTAQASAPAPTTATPTNHEVQPGETLWAISRRYNVTVNALMQANNITDASLIQSGTVLRIPSN